MLVCFQVNSIPQARDDPNAAPPVLRDRVEIFKQRATVRHFPPNLRRRSDPTPRCRYRVGLREAHRGWEESALYVWQVQTSLHPRNCDDHNHEHPDHEDEIALGYRKLERLWRQ